MDSGPEKSRQDAAHTGSGKRFSRVLESIENDGRRREDISSYVWFRGFFMNRD